MSTQPGCRRFRFSWWLAATLFAAVVLALLWGTHQMHILGALPFLILLACPLIHFFMHRKHGDGHHGPPSQTRH